MYLKKMQNIKQQVLHYKAKVQNPKYIETKYKLSHVITNKQSIKHMQLFLSISTPPIIILPLSSLSPPFCDGITSPHFLLASFGFSPIGFGEKGTLYHNGCGDGVGE